MPRIQLIEDLTSTQVPQGSNLLVEFDPSSRWYNASLNIAASWLRQDGVLIYNAGSQTPDDIRSMLQQLSVNVAELEGAGRLMIYDWYTTTLGQKSREKFAIDSLKAHDLSIFFAKEAMHQAPNPDLLRIGDNVSTLARFNDDKAWTEFLLTRSFPSSMVRKSTQILGVASGVHSESVYRTLEAAADGIIDFKVDQSGDELKNLMRIRNMRKVVFDARWHLLRLNENLEIDIEKLT